MCTVVAAALGAVGSIMQGQSAKSAANAQAAAYEQNAKIADMQATEAVKAGGREERDIRRRLSQTGGRQAVIGAASGLASNSGSLTDIREQSVRNAEEDVATNALNHAREAWAHNVEAINYRNQASAARASGKNAFMSGLIGAGTSLLSLASPGMFGGSNTLKVDPYQYSSPIGPMDTYDSSKIKRTRWA